jgi:hypothetical protein
LSGSVNVDHILISIFPGKEIPGPHYAETFYFPSAATPIPAALPLFASALAGLGVLAWRRKQAAGTTPPRRPDDPLLSNRT